MGFFVVPFDVVLRPQVGFRLILRLVKVVHRLVGFLDGPEGAFPLAFGAGGHPPPVLACRHMRHRCHAEVFHDVLEHQAFADGAVVQVKHFRHALEGIVLRLGGHGVIQKPQGGLDILAIHAAVFHVGRAASVVHQAVQYQRGASPARVVPEGLSHPLQIRWAQIKMPAFVAMRSLEAGSRRLPGQLLVAHAAVLEIAIGGGDG